MLEVLGAENAFAKIEKRSSVISLEVAIAANPDVICCSWCGVKKLRREKFCLGAAGKKFLLYQKTMSTTCRNHSLVGQVQDCWMVWKSFRACCAACARMTSCKFPSHSRKVMLHWCIEKVLLVACLRFGTRVRLDSQEIFDARVRTEESNEGSVVQR